MSTIKVARDCSGHLYICLMSIQYFYLKVYICLLMYTVDIYVFNTVIAVYMYKYVRMYICIYVTCGVPIWYSPLPVWALS